MDPEWHGQVSLSDRRRERSSTLGALHRPAPLGGCAALPGDDCDRSPDAAGSRLSRVPDTRSRRRVGARAPGWLLSVAGAVLAGLVAAVTVVPAVERACGARRRLEARGRAHTRTVFRQVCSVIGHNHTGGAADGSIGAFDRGPTAYFGVRHVRGHTRQPG